MMTFIKPAKSKSANEAHNFLDFINKKKAVWNFFGKGIFPGENTVDFKINWSIFSRSDEKTIFMLSSFRSNSGMSEIQMAVNIRKLAANAKGPGAKYAVLYCSTSTPSIVPIILKISTITRQNKTIVTLNWRVGV